MTPILQHSNTPILPLVREVTSRLTAAGLDEAGLKAELLVAHVLEVPRLEIFSMDAKTVPAALHALIDRAVRGEPIQYVIGDANFLGHVIKTDRRALIPRPETEQLVERVLKTPGRDVADVGTGTGCIAIALALARPESRCIATDISDDALDLARENARRLGAPVAFHATNLLEGLEPATLDIVVSNPPYISESEFSTLQKEVRDFEPRLALDGGAHGLEVIARLIPQAFQALRAGGHLFLEIGETQGARVAGLLRNEGFHDVVIEPDAMGHERFAIGRRP